MILGTIYAPCTTLGSCGDELPKVSSAVHGSCAGPWTLGPRFYGFSSGFGLIRGCRGLGFMA